MTRQCDAVRRPFSGISYSVCQWGDNLLAAVTYGLFILAESFVLLLGPVMERHPKEMKPVSSGPIVLLSCNDPPAWAGSVLSATIVLSSCLFPNGFVDLT